MDLDSFINTNEESFEVWFEFRDFEIKVRYMDKSKLNKMLERSKVRRYDRRTHQPLEDVSDEKLCRNLAQLIIDWRGLTLGKLAEFVPIKIDPAEADKPVVFSAKNAETMLSRPSMP